METRVILYNVNHFYFLFEYIFFLKIQLAKSWCFYSAVCFPINTDAVGKKTLQNFLLVWSNVRYIVTQILQEWKCGIKWHNNFPHIPFCVLTVWTYTVMFLQYLRKLRSITKLLKRVVESAKGATNFIMKMNSTSGKRKTR